MSYHKTEITAGFPLPVLLFPIENVNEEEGNANYLWLVISNNGIFFFAERGTDVHISLCMGKTWVPSPGERYHIK